MKALKLLKKQQYKNILTKLVIAVFGYFVITSANAAVATSMDGAGNNSGLVAISNAMQSLDMAGARLSGGAILPSLGAPSGDYIWEAPTLWMHGFSNKSKLDTASGYDADATGVALGGEYLFTDKTKFGLAYTFSDADIDTDFNQSVAKTNTAIFYGEYRDMAWFVNGMISYSFGDYSETATDKTAEYGVDSYALQLQTGYSFYVCGADITPMMGARYIYIDSDSYTDSTGTRFEHSDNNMLTGIAGAKGGRDILLGSGLVLRPEAKVVATYDFIRDKAISTVGLLNGASYTIEGSSMDAFAIEASFGVNLRMSRYLEVGVSYAGKFRKDYTDNTGVVSAKIRF